MVKTDADLYLEAVNKKLVCPRRIRKKFLSQLSADVTELAETCKSEPTTADLEARFGTPEEVAVGFLYQMSASGLSHWASQKRVAIIIVAITCLLILLTIFMYTGYDRWKKEQFENGHVVVTNYETVNGTPPPEPEGTRVY